MVGDILTLSRIEAGRVGLSEERFDLRQILEDIGQIFQSRAEGKSLRFSLELAGDLPSYLLGDAGKLRQVLINLLDNAVKFTQKGAVSLRARARAMEEISDTMMLHLEVEDSGLGIPQDHLDEIFETFVRYDHDQQSQTGTGLGLSISKSLVEMMGGEIAVESEVGQGTIFKVNIPMLLADGEAVMPDETPLHEVVGLQAGQPDWRILVVDDNRENLLLLTNLLAQAGFTLQEAENGAEAVAKFQEWRPQFIWMDIRMPVMDGYEAAKKIRALPGGDEVKIVAVTASVLEDPQKVTLPTGIDDVVLKPFRDHEIFDVMATELGVEYLYRDRPEKPAEPEGAELSSEMLADLPPELLQELRQTTLVADRGATLEVIGRIEEYAPETATKLQKLVENYQIGRVRELLKETETKNDI
jgi:CheY-like chemotaxis protein/two-component sensor histidine kinase